MVGMGVAYTQIAGVGPVVGFSRSHEGADELSPIVAARVLGDAGRIVGLTPGPDILDAEEYDLWDKALRHLEDRICEQERVLGLSAWGTEWRLRG
jgi:hypothetical protein